MLKGQCHTFLANHLNKLKYVTITTFNHLTNSIQTLYLDQNEISDIEPYSFSNMTNLAELYIQMNQLKSIRNRTFFNLNSFSRFELLKNELQIIDSYSFDGMTYLKEFK